MTMSRAGMAGVVAVAVIGVSMVVGCGRNESKATLADGSPEASREALDKAAQSAADASKSLAEATKEASDQAVKKTGQALEKAGSAVEKTGENMQK